MKTFTKEFMNSNCGCYSQEQLQACSFMQQEPITLLSIIASEIPLKDKFWFVCKKIATKEENQQIAIQCAETVLPIYEGKYPESKAPREAIEAAKLYITGHISLEQLFLKRRAADDAAADDAAATYATYAAATYAAYAAAAYAIYAADAYATYATYAAAAYAIYAADADVIKQQLLNILINYCTNE